MFSLWDRKTTEICVKWGCLNYLKKDKRSKNIHPLFQGEEAICHTTGVMEIKGNVNYKPFILSFIISLPFFIILIFVF